MTFTYNRDIPDGPNNPSQDQPKMKVNTNSTDDLINVDHVSFQQADGGNHRKSTYLSNTYTLVAPPASIAGQVVVYAYNTGPGGNALALVRDGVATGFQLTNTQYPALTATDGFSWLPGGIIIQWGKKAAPGSSGVVTFPLSFPSGNPPLSIQVSLERNSGNQSVTVDSATPPSAAGFDYLSSTGGSVNLFWIAIGN